MKKLAFLVAAMLAIGTSSFAQGFGWGVKVGLNVSDISKISNADAKSGLTAGVFADYKFNDWFGVSADLLFSRQGAKAKEDGAKYTLKTNYLNLPILANFYVLDALAFKVGIQPGVFLSAKDKYKDGNGNEISESANDRYKSIDFAFPVGVSYEFFHKIILDARYNIGVAKILNGEFEGFKPNAHNNTFTLSVGYRF